MSGHSGLGDIGHAFAGQLQATIEEARMMLAQAVINAASLGYAEADTLKQEAIRAVKTVYPDLPI